jgi:hypothetical protein
MKSLVEYKMARTRTWEGTVKKCSKIIKNARSGSGIVTNTLQASLQNYNTIPKVIEGIIIIVCTFVQDNIIIIATIGIKPEKLISIIVIIKWINN